jgi:metal-responsive CopG/Arc/MetJ family transcriptional regulator
VARKGNAQGGFMAAMVEIISARVPDHLFNTLNSYAKATNTDRSKIINDALSIHLNKLMGELGLKE